jgi:hypothetical protein
MDGRKNPAPLWPTRTVGSFPVSWSAARTTARGAPVIAAPLRSGTATSWPDGCSASATHCQVVGLTSGLCTSMNLMAASLPYSIAGPRRSNSRGADAV